MRIRFAGAAIAPLMMVCAAPAAAFPADFAEKADAVLASSYASDAPGAAAIVMDDGKVVYQSGRGLADVMAKRAITPDTVFRLGSITKQFTAAVILQLVEEGKVSLSDPLSKYLPDYPKPGADATVAQLLNHTSGIQSYTGLPGWMSSDKPAQALTTAALVAEFRNAPVEFERGTQFSYNNSGYVLLGAIVEKATGKPWHQAVEERISKPLGLTTIRYGVDERAMPAMASGYTMRDGMVAPSRAIHMSVPHAAGGLVGSVGDLARWAHALHHGKVVKSETYKQMIAPTKLADGKENPYAFGIANMDVRERKAIGHGGGIFGFSTDSVYVPEEDLFVAVFTNSDEPQTDPEIAMLRLAALAMDDPYVSLSKADVPIAEVEPFFGVYRVDGGERRFFARDGKLFTRRTGGSDMEVQAAGGGRFFYPGSLTWFTLSRDAGGQRMMTMHHGGEKKGQTVAWAGPMPPEVLVDVPRATLERYAGAYQFGPAPVAVALGEDGRLTVKLGSQHPVTVVPTSLTEFRAETVDAKVIFHEKDGAVTHLTIEQRGQKRDAQRVTG